MNEYFASSADVYRILGALPDGADKMSTADGREKTIAASCARLARMVGREADEADVSEWRALARWFAEAQTRDICDAAWLRLSRGDVAADAPIVAAGIGKCDHGGGRSSAGSPVADVRLPDRRPRRSVALRAGGRRRHARRGSGAGLERVIPGDGACAIVPERLLGSETCVDRVRQ